MSRCSTRGRPWHVTRCVRKLAAGTRARSAHPIDAERGARRPVAFRAAGGALPPHCCLLAELLGVRCVSRGDFSGRLVPARATQEKWVTSPGPGPLLLWLTYIKGVGFYPYGRLSLSFPTLSSADNAPRRAEPPRDYARGARRAGVGARGRGHRHGCGCTGRGSHATLRSR
eukprot:scaffold57739_cov78-Phaeocystis_antarctica.AAC.6